MANLFVWSWPRMMIPTALGALALSACASTSVNPGKSVTTPTTNSSPTVVPTQALGQQYLALAAPVNAARLVFATKLTALPSTATDSDVYAVAAPYAVAIATFNSALLRLPFPDSMTADVSALVAANAAQMGNLNGSAVVTVSSISSWAQQLTADFSKVNTAANVVRADLGLPAPPHAGV